MTTPTPDSFDYTDDSVIARVSFDVPSSAIGDVSQLTAAMGAMRTELEAIARAQADWLGYLQQVPAITQQANQALREQITIMERLSYAQGQAGGGGGYGGGGGGGGQAGGGGSYSTAAPPGYVPPFKGMTEGTGEHGGQAGGGGAGGMEQYLRNMQGNDPRGFANVTSVRGKAVNPALLGGIAGVVGAASGWGSQAGGGGDGDDPMGNTGPQPTGGARTSSGPPSTAKGGAPEGSEAINDMGEPSADAPTIQKTAANMMNEMRAGRLGSKVAQILGGGGRDGGDGSGANSGGGSNSTGKGSNALGTFTTGILQGALGNRMGGAIGGMLSKPAVQAAGIAGLGLAGFAAAQNIGERVTTYTQEGSVQGGGFVEGVGQEVSARIMALNPFITTDQARQVMQQALKQGFRGGEGDTVQDFMIRNFKDMSMSFADSIELVNASVVKGGESSQDFTKNMTDLQDSLDLMKGLSKEGGAALPQREEQFKETVSTLTSMNVGQDSAQRAALGLQEMFKDNKVLRDAAPGIANGAAQNPLFLTQVANRHGITGMLPGATQGALEDAGIDFDEAFLEQARYVANMVKGYPGGMRNQAEMFRQLMAEQGAPMDPKAAYEMYKELTGGRDIEGDVAKSIDRGAGSQTIGSRLSAPIRGMAKTFGLTAIDNLVKGDFMGAAREISEGPSTFASMFGGDREADRSADSFAASRADGAAFSPAGVPSRVLPRSPDQVTPGGNLTAQGNVTGEVRITVDQAGRVTAPPTIQLTGQQKAALAGYGSTQLNNPPPGDPTYYHAYNPFPDNKSKG